ncbi:asialoglycoprotein receptor 2-like [Oryzias latipes]|uniref:asialoglycoprotein receptor 2-like n=1 Tax=Oryzias latipes TaxID=8090 RepID=UPI0009D9800E|nr:asialoglycoprotein receptor 2-like [Oryzias latipes]
MEAIYENFEPEDPVCKFSLSNPPASIKSTRRFYLGVITFMVMLSVLLLAGVIILGLLYGDTVRHLSEISDNKDNLTEHLNAVIERMNSSLIETTKKLMDYGESVRHLSEISDKKDNLTEHLNAVIERMNSSLIETTKKLMDFRQRKTRCPKKWIGFGSSCYFLSEESKTWDEAREFCRARGADLVVINTEEENEFISALKKQQVWIGLTDRDLEGTWKSVDGSSLNLTFWGSGQPDDYDKEEDCGETNFEFLGHWNDVPCHLSRQLICEKEEMLFV